MDTIIKVYDYCDDILRSIERMRRSAIDFALNGADEVKTIIEENSALFPYSANIIKELPINENANSRILGTLFRFCSEEQGYWVLQNFLNYIGLEVNVEEPEILVETERIDISVREGKKYAIIFENKIYYADIQKNQLARYIVKMEAHQVKRENIYVVLLPPTPSYNFPDCCWVPEPKDNSQVCQKCDKSSCAFAKKSLRPLFADRTAIADFKTIIYPWLKELISQIPGQEILLKSAVIQYADYLGDLYMVDKKYQIIHMKTQEYLEQKLALSGKDKEECVKILSDKIDDIETLLEEMRTMKDKCIQEAAEEGWNEVVDIIDHSFKVVAEEFGLEYMGWEKRGFEENRYWMLKKKSWRLGIVFDNYKYQGGLQAYIGLPYEEDCGVSEKCSYLGHSTAKGYPYGYMQVWDDDMLSFIRKVKDGSFESDVKASLKHVLDTIRENGISMR